MLRTTCAVLRVRGSPRLTLTGRGVCLRPGPRAGRFSAGGPALRSAARCCLALAECRGLTSGRGPSAPGIVRESCSGSMPSAWTAVKLSLTRTRRPVACQRDGWQKTPKSGPMTVAGDTAHPVLFVMECHAAPGTDDLRPDHRTQPLAYRSCWRHVWRRRPVAADAEGSPGAAVFAGTTTTAPRTGRLRAGTG
jgi:hypothetical protein